MNQVNHRRAPFAKRARNAVLWTTEVLWGAFFSITGFGKVLCYRPDVWKQTLHQRARGSRLAGPRRCCSVWYKLTHSLKN